jgi:hypothetical protein
MALLIHQIRALIRTGNKQNAETDGWVYLGICGREFRLAMPNINDFTKDSEREYLLGASSNVEDAEFNDPRKPQLSTSDLDLYPAYIRFEPAGDGPDWNVDEARITVKLQNSAEVPEYARLGHDGGQTLWLGQKMGKFCYLKKMS